jgi:hypothetical protein
MKRLLLKPRSVRLEWFYALPLLLVKQYPERRESVWSIHELSTRALLTIQCAEQVCAFRSWAQPFSISSTPATMTPDCIRHCQELLAEAIQKVCQIPIDIKSAH